MGILAKGQPVDAEPKVFDESIHGPHVTEVTAAFVDLVGASAFDRPTLSGLCISISLSGVDKLTKCISNARATSVDDVDDETRPYKVKFKSHFLRPSCISGYGFWCRHFAASQECGQH